MIKLKKENTNKKTIYWTSNRISCPEDKDIDNITKRLLRILTHYINKHPNLKLISYSFVHDNGEPYYDWLITAIFEVK